MEQDQGRDPVPEETKGIKKERHVHIQIENGENKTETEGSVQTQSTI